jgi:uncharacterized protein (TIRG00374 family)
MRISTKKLIMVGVLTASIYAIMLFIGDFKKVINIISGFSPLIFMLLIVLTFINNLTRFVRWNIFLKSARINIPLSHNLLIYFSSFALLVTPARSGGELLKLHLLKEKFKQPLRKSSAVVITDRVIDAVGIALLGVIWIPIIAGGKYASYFLVFFAISAVGLLLLKSERIYSLAVRFSKSKTSVIKDLKFSFTELLSPSTIALTTLISAFAWFFEALALYIILLHLNQNPSFALITFIFSFSMLFGNMVMMPGGIGAVEGSMVAMLVQLAHVGMGVAVAATLIFRLASFWTINFAGIICYLAYEKWW